ncbi:hypothetical protein HPA99_08425 [Streptococcus suis]|nr:hypothetical protein [Streptococcus suis]
MKKIILLLSVVLLTACKSGEVKQETAASSQSSSQATSSSTTSTTSSQSETKMVDVDYSSYQKVIDRYQASLGLELSALNREEVSSLLYGLKQYPTVYTGAYYIQNDFDKDGVDELAVALSTNSQFVLIDIYTVGNDGQLIRLVDQFRQQGPEIGEKVTLWPLEDGSYSLESAGSFKNYRYDSAVGQLSLQAEGATNPSSAAVVDLSALSWLKFEKGTPVQEHTSATTINLQGLLAGDFSSIAGTWSNANGKTLSIDSLGNVTNEVDAKIELKEIDANGIGIGGYHFGMHGAVFRVIPSGVAFEFPNTGETDLSDISRVRLFISQALPSAEEFVNEVYYKQ